MYRPPMPQFFPRRRTNLLALAGAISLTLPNDEVWVFRHGGEATMQIRPSVYFDTGRLRPRATKQIVLTSRVTGYGAAVSWTIARPAALLPAPDLPY